MPSHTAPPLFYIPEILTAILQNLTPRDLLVSAQRVNRLFHETTTKSPALRQLLYFDPSSPEFNDTTKFNFNPLLRDAFFPFFQSSSNWGYKELDKCDWLSQLEAMEWNKTPERITAFAREEASWRNMLLTEPSVTICGLKQVIESMSGSYECGGKALNIAKEGIRMGALYDLVQGFVYSDTHGYIGFGFHWDMNVPADWEKWSDLLNGEEVCPRVFLTFTCVDSCGMTEQSRDRPHMKSKGHSVMNIKWGMTNYLDE